MSSSPHEHPGGIPPQWGAPDLFGHLRDDHDVQATPGEGMIKLLERHDAVHNRWIDPDPGKLWHLPHASAEDAYDYINGELTPEVIAKFIEKQADYRGGPAFLFLGSKGQFSDINRKFWKLYAAVWEGQELEGEQAEEIVMDLVGHCLLLIYSLRREASE